MAKSVSLAIDGEALVNRIAEKYDVKLPPKIVMWHYDGEADTLYLHFEYPAKAVDSQMVDREGQIILGRDPKNAIVSMTIVNAFMMT